MDYEAARRVLDWIGAGDLAEKSVSALSGGQRQKVYIAMALAQDTDIVLMDEPTTYLDIRNQMEVMALARRLAELGKAVVMVVHDLGAVLRNADEVLLLHDGRVTACGSPAEVYASGRLQPAFGVAVHAVDTPDGIQYYCTPV